MSIKQIQPRFIVLLLFIVAGGVLRVLAAGQLTPFSNFSPLGAMALFGGAMFADKWKSYLFPLLALFLSDVIMMKTVYAAYADGFLFEGWYWNYIGFAAMVLIGQLVIRNVKVLPVLGASILAAVVYWLIVDFGTWMRPTSIDMTTGLPFSRDFAGLMKCYALGIPFIKNTLISNVVYSGIFFGLFSWLENRVPALSAR